MRKVMYKIVNTSEPADETNVEMVDTMPVEEEPESIDASSLPADRCSKRQKLNYFNSGRAKRCRLSGHHVQNRAHSRKYCYLCSTVERVGDTQKSVTTGRRTEYLCSICKVPLCITVPKGSSADTPSCSDIWHTVDMLPVAASNDDVLQQ